MTICLFPGATRPGKKVPGKIAIFVTGKVHLMKKSISFIFTHAVIILVMAFVSLPCSVKREIKQALNIPVSHSEKPNQTIVCTAFVQEENRGISVSSQKKELKKKQLRATGFAFLETSVLHQSVFAFPGINRPSPVPIYILHEQYLI